MTVHVQFTAPSHLDNSLNNTMVACTNKDASLILVMAFTAFQFLVHDESCEASKLFVCMLSGGRHVPGRSQTSSLNNSTSAGCIKYEDSKSHSLA